MEDKIATAADFEAAARQRRMESAVVVKLPSGLTVMACRLPPEWWIRNIGRMPQSIAAGFTKADAGAVGSATDLLELARLTTNLICDCIVAPVIKLNPGPGEVDPALISDDDLNFILRFAGGEIDAAGKGLDAFPAGSRSTAAAGPGLAAVG